MFRRTDPLEAAAISELRRAVGFRNLLAHDYGAVDDEIVWQIATYYAPLLRHTVSQLLDRESGV